MKFTVGRGRALEVAEEINSGKFQGSVVLGSQGMAKILVVVQPGSGRPGVVEEDGVIPEGYVSDELGNVVIWDLSVGTCGGGADLVMSEVGVRAGQEVRIDSMRVLVKEYRLGREDALRELVEKIDALEGAELDQVDAQTLDWVLEKIREVGSP